LDEAVADPGNTSMSLVLYHVIATTEADDDEQARKLVALIELAKGASAPSRDAGRRESYDWEPNAYLSSLLKCRLREGGAAWPDDVVRIIRRLPSKPGVHDHFVSLCLRHPGVGRVEKMTFLNQCSDILPAATFLTFRRGLLVQRLLAAGVEPPRADAESLLDEADELWTLMSAASGSPEMESPPAGMSIDSWDSSVHELLLMRCRLALGVLHDRERLSLADEYAARYPDRAPTVARMVRQAFH